MSREDDRPRSRVFFQIRVMALLTILAGVLLWGYHDMSRRRSRTTWQRLLDVALVIVEREPLAASAVSGVRARSRALEERLAAEFARYRPTSNFVPFRFEVYGPTRAEEAPPKAPDGGLTELARFAYELFRYTGKIDGAVGLRASSVDSIIYLVARPPRSNARSFVEGTSQEGGKVGLVEIELDDEMVDLGLFVATHELLHTLGASDKYDASGHTLVPEGLAEPGRVPLYPQRFAEVMARDVPLGPAVERAPASLDELSIGSASATEIGWR